MKKKHQFNLGYVFIALWAILFFQYAFGPASQQQEITYSQFLDYLEQGQIAKVEIDDRFVRGDFTQPINNKSRFITPRMEVELADELEKYNVDYTGVVSGNFFTNLLSWMAPTLFFLFIWFFLFRRFAERQGMGGLMNIGKSRAKVLMEKHTGVTFRDVAGIDEAKAELEEVVHFLKDPGSYSRLGAHIPKGVLLVGPPGTGKTLLARAVAGEAGVTFFSISGSEFIEMFVGVGAARVRDLFEQAKTQSPAIIFIDELDALGRARGVGPVSGGHDEREQTLNQLLAEMDGFDPSEGVIILGATNRPEILDPALLRAGRFDRQVLVDRPDKNGRRQILEVHIKKIKVEDNLDLDAVAALTTGFSGADLANLVNEAALIATRHQGEKVSLDDFVNAIERIVAGLEKRSRLIKASEKRVVAFHESGHALVGMLLNPDQAVQKVSVIPRGIGALGYTIQRPSEDSYLLSRDDLNRRIAVLLAGRAAEKLVFNEITTGAADDLAKATDLAKAMVTRYGMSDEVGLLSLEEKHPNFLEVPDMAMSPAFGENMADRVATAVSAIMNQAFDVATAVLAHNREVLNDAAEQLIKEETLVEAQLAGYRDRLKPVEQPA